MCKTKTEELVKSVIGERNSGNKIKINENLKARQGFTSASALAVYHWVLAETLGDLVKKQKMSANC